MRSRKQRDNQNNPIMFGSVSKEFIQKRKNHKRNDKIFGSGGHWNIIGENLWESASTMIREKLIFLKTVLGKKD